MESSSDNANPKKRTPTSEYEEVNNFYKELYEQRQKAKKESQIHTILTTPNESNSKQETGKKEEEANNQSQASVSNKISSESNQTKTLSTPTPIPKESLEKHKKESLQKNFQANSSFPILPHINESRFLLNKLNCYPKDAYLEHMVSFREMLFEEMFTHTEKNQNKTLQSAFMTTFGFEVELLKPIVQAGVKLTIANDYNRDSKYEPLIKNFEGYENFNLISPPKNAHGVFYGVFHPKLWLLKFPNFLRVVIGSGNLTIEDWSVWSNCLWHQDFQKKEEKFIKRKEKKERKNEQFDFDGNFKETLLDFIQNIMPKKIDFKNLTEIDIDEYEFEDIDVVLISSVPGRYPINSEKKYGLARVKEIMSIFEKENQKENRMLTYQTTSLGSVDANFISDFYYSFNSKPNKIMKIIYPTEHYVVNESYAGYEYAAPLCLMSKNFEKTSFVKECLYKFEGSEDYNFHHGILPHLKVCLLTNEKHEINDSSVIYFGSHNCTSSAWGKYEKNKSQILVSNTELGILIPPGNGSAERLKKYMASGLPFKMPPNPYGKNDKPWIADKYKP